MLPITSNPTWKPYPTMPPVQPAWALNGLMAQLGLQTKLEANGNVQFNEPLAQQITAYGSAALPSLQTFLMSAGSIPALVEGLHTAGRLAEAGVPNINNLVPVLVRWNSHPDPIVQMHLLRFYRKIDAPGTVGTVLSTLVHHAVNQYPLQSSPTFNVIADAGETLLTQIARRTADETIQRLRPYLQPTQRSPQPSR